MLIKTIKIDDTPVSFTVDYRANPPFTLRSKNLKFSLLKVKIKIFLMSVFLMRKYRNSIFDLFANEHMKKKIYILAKLKLPKRPKKENSYFQMWPTVYKTGDDTNDLE